MLFQAVFNLLICRLQIYLGIRHHTKQNQIAALYSNCLHFLVQADIFLECSPKYIIALIFLYEMIIEYNKNDLKSVLEHASRVEFKIKWDFPFLLQCFSYWT